VSPDPAPSVTRLGSTPSSHDSDSSAFDEGGFTPGTLLLGRYRIVGLIGRGGMGEVYRAQDLKLGQTVALKFLPEVMDREKSRLDRFLNEVRVARQISHPHVCRVYDVADVDGRHFLSMEFVDGEDLASLLRRIGRLPPDKGIETARQICAGLAAAHDRGVLHRDLKPANIMIDGRGQARLADFGLAAAAEDLRLSGEIAGTPAYMAPEQLDGGALTVKTDLYALGLVLHEIFTGQRLFENVPLQELRALRRQQSPSDSSLSTSGVELDPAVERVIRRCLDPDPSARPASALAVAAALPGGDPLAAALAAGETPSPELVAGAGAVGALGPRTAWMLLVVFVAGLVASAWFASEVRFYRLVPNMRSPEVLASRAEDLLDRIGYGSFRSDRAYGWRLNRSVEDYTLAHDRTRDRWQRLVEADAPVVQFWYRQSPVPLVPFNYSNNATPDDPPLVTPGMARVTVTSRGRLVSFQAVPVQSDAASTAATTPLDWSALFAEAGLDMRAFKAVDARATPPTFADARAAWEGVDPLRSEWTLRVEAAAYQSRPVFFSVLFPWAQEGGDARESADPLSLLRTSIQVGVGIVAFVFGIWLARRNLRAGRADIRGAFIIALVVGVPLLVAPLLGVTHKADPGLEWGRFIRSLGSALVLGVQFWLVYLALEPFVRRRWPESLIAWTRLLAGRFRDPLVGRDVLIGMTAGIAVSLLGDVLDALPGWIGQPPISPLGGTNALAAMETTGTFLAALVTRLPRVVSESLVILFILSLALVVFRNRWLAYAAMTLLFVPLGVNREAIVLSSLSIVALISVIVILVSRVGLLSLMAAMFVTYSISELPLTLDVSSWFINRSETVAVMLIGVAAWSFYTALGGRSLLGSAFEP
jgi:serine/threonine-protein kinase